jgi:hypothetical protein
VRTRMPDRVGAGGEKPPATRLGGAATPNNYDVHDDFIFFIFPEIGMPTRRDCPQQP